MEFFLNEKFIQKYAEIEPKWGFVDAGGNSVGELTCIRTYSRVKQNGNKERWFEICERVINGMYTLQKRYCKSNHLPWNDNKAQASAQEAYDLMFDFKWTPAGRGIYQMGAPLVMDHNNGAVLMNCAVVSTADIDKSDPGKIFSWFLEALAHGIGVSADMLGANKQIMIHAPSADVIDFVVPDSREGWAEALRLQINSFLKPNGHKYIFNYDEVRPYGTELKTFGGTASGPEPLRFLLDKVADLCMRKVGQTLDSELITDIFNLIGGCIVAGSSRRSAELMLGEDGDEAFFNLKNANRYPERNSYDADEPGWSWASNNSISVNVGADYSKYVDRIASNGEPGFIWLDVARTHGRLADGFNDSDHRVVATNPCGEQFLESMELCNLSEIHLNRIESLEELKRVSKFCYLYSKTVTLLPTPWDKSNAVMKRNNRIGLSMTGIVGWLEDHSLAEYRTWADTNYKEIRNWDKIYSEWLGVRESIRVTTEKPSGSVALLSGATPGCHWSPGGEYYLRAVRFGTFDKALRAFKKAGYLIEDDLVTTQTKVVYFPIKGASKRSEKEVSIFEKIHLASQVQKYWSDNGVSVTVSFDKETESKHIETVLGMYEGTLKAVSFLPMGNKVYPQQPYTEITKEEYDEWQTKLKPIDTSIMYTNGVETGGEKFCSNDSCTI